MTQKKITSGYVGRILFELPVVVVMQSEEYGEDRYTHANLREAIGCIKRLILSAHIQNDGVKRIIGIEINGTEDANEIFESVEGEGGY